jgi:hypothetical protein
MAGLLERVAPFAPPLEVKAETMAAEDRRDPRRPPGHPMLAATMPGSIGPALRQTFEAAAAGCGFTLADLDTKVRVSLVAPDGGAPGVRLPPPHPPGAPSRRR